MNSVEDSKKWKDNLFDEVFDSVSEELLREKDKNKNFSVSDLEARLNDRYLSLGHAWDGGSPLNEVRLSAEIAAIEVFLVNLKGSLSPLKRI